MSYRIYYEINSADTIRDPDDISITEIATCETEDEALNIAQDFIDNHFWKNHTKLCKSQDNKYYYSQEICSYGRTLKIERSL